MGPSYPPAFQSGPAKAQGLAAHPAELPEKRGLEVFGPGCVSHTPLYFLPGFEQTFQWQLQRLLLRPRTGMCVAYVRGWLTKHRGWAEERTQLPLSLYTHC